MRRNSSLCLDRCEAGVSLKQPSGPRKETTTRNKNANSNGCKHGKSFRHFSGSEWKEREKSGVFSICLDRGIVQFFPLASSELFWLHLLSFTLYFAAFSLAPYRPAYLLSLFFCFYFYLSIPLAFSRSLPASLWRGISFAQLLMYPEIGSDTVVFIFPFFAFLISRFLPLCFPSLEKEIFLFDFFAIEIFTLILSPASFANPKERSVRVILFRLSIYKISLCVYDSFSLVSMSFDVFDNAKTFLFCHRSHDDEKGQIYRLSGLAKKAKKRERRRAANGLHKSSVHSVVCDSGGPKIKTNTVLTSPFERRRKGGSKRRLAPD